MTTLTKIQQNHLNAYLKSLTQKGKEQAKQYYKALMTISDQDRFNTMRNRWGVSVNIRTFNKLTTKSEKNAYFKKCLLLHFTKKAEKTKKDINDILNADDFKSLEIRTNWVKSRTWGNNPNSRGWINNSNYTESNASGCGYDKYSATINTFLNNNIIKKAILLKVLKYPLNRWKREDYNSKNILPYCVYIDFYGLHIGANGAGFSTCRNILEFAGATVEKHGDDTWDLLTAKVGK